MSKIAIISGRFPSTQFNSSINHKLYADKYGYTYINCNWPTKAKNLYLNKIYYIISYLHLFDYLIWIDDDAFFLDFDKDIMTYAPQGEHFISFCKSPDFKDLKTYLSSGQFIVKSNDMAKFFFKDILNQNLNKIKLWWQGDLGYFSNGDQDIMVYMLLSMSKYHDRFKLYNYKAFNSRFENLKNIDVHTPLILHFTGVPAIKKSNYEKAQTMLNLNSSLVSKAYLSEYKIPVNVKKSFYKKLKKKIRLFLND